MRITKNTACTADQQGVATIFMTMILLLAVGLIALYTNRSAILEQRLSANEIRAKQAFAAANAGIDQALAHMRKGGVYQNADLTTATIAVDVLPAITLTSTNGQLSSYKVIYCDSAMAIPVCPATPSTAFAACSSTAASSPIDSSKVITVSCGWSDDNSSVQRVVQGMGSTPSLAGTVTTPVVTKGASNLLTGGASILNYFNDLTVWTGGSFLGQSNTGKTFIRNKVTNPTASLTDPYRDTGNSPGCNNSPAGYECSTQGSTQGHDTVTGDTNLSSLSSEGFFSYFFGQGPTAYRTKTATWVVDLTNSLSVSDSTNLNSIVGMGDKAIWVEGNATLPGNVGSQAHPVVLIINGDLNLGSNSEVNGFVFVTGTITGSGSPTVYGALVSNGSANVTGNLKVVYDPKALAGAANLGKAAKLQGSWRDW